MGEAGKRVIEMIVTVLVSNQGMPPLSVLLAAIVFSVAAPVVAAVLFLPVMLLAGPHSAILPSPLAGMVWFAAIASVILVPAWLARVVYRLRRPAAGSSP